MLIDRNERETSWVKGTELGQETVVEFDERTTRQEIVGVKSRREGSER
jgi:hypothetical protein